MTTDAFDLYNEYLKETRNMARTLGIAREEVRCNMSFEDWLSGETDQVEPVQSKLHVIHVKVKDAGILAYDTFYKLSDGTQVIVRAYTHSFETEIVSTCTQAQKLAVRRYWEYSK